MSEPTRQFRYEVLYNEEFHQQVAAGDHNPLCDLRVVAGGEDLAGAPPGEYYIDDYLYFHFNEVVLNLIAVLDGERRDVELSTTPVTFVFRPEGDSVFVSFHFGEVPGRETSPIDGEVEIETRVLTTGVADAVTEFYDQLARVDESVADSEPITTLRREADKLRAKL
jgi:hypothetical protein